jgi:type IV secretory pathway VirB6-like protein
MKALNDDIQGEEVKELLSSHLHKPEKVEIYHTSLQKFFINQHLRFAATWSWWAFFGRAFFFFYRKIYLFGLIFLIIDIFTAATMPFIYILSGICYAIVAKYLYCKKFVDDLGIAGYSDKSRAEVTRNISLLGGYNNWAIVVYFIWMFGTIVFMVFIGAFILSLLGG